VHREPIAWVDFAEWYAFLVRGQRLPLVLVQLVQLVQLGVAGEQLGHMEVVEEGYYSPIDNLFFLQD